MTVSDMPTITDGLRSRVDDIEDRVHELEEELDRMNRDQMSIIFLCAVATTLCMVFCIALLVI